MHHDVMEQYLLAGGDSLSAERRPDPIRDWPDPIRDWQEDQHTLERNFNTFVTRYGMDDWLRQRQIMRWKDYYLANDGID